MSSLSQIIRHSAQVSDSKTATHFNDRSQTWLEFQDRISRLAPVEFIHWLNDSGSKAVFVDDMFLPVNAQIRSQLPAVKHFVYTGEGTLPEVTAQTLRDGWLHTGDGGRLDDDGMLFIVDRVKDIIVSGGENVYSAETEQAVYQHPAVAECAVIGIPHESWGEQVHAIVVLKPGESLTEQQLIDHCKTIVAGYKCPRSVAFRKEPLPLSGAGKILKKDLRAPYWEGQDRDIG